MDAIRLRIDTHDEPGDVNIYNLGTDETCSLDDSVQMINGTWGSSPTIARGRRARLDRRQPAHPARHAVRRSDGSRR